MKTSIRERNGFTIVELLVIIAIIGILAVVTLVLLSAARDSGKDANIKTSMQSLQGAADTYYNGPGQYHYGAAPLTVGFTPTGGTVGAPAGVCADPDVVKLLKAAAAQAGQTAYCYIGTGGESYVTAVALHIQGQFCVDGTAFSGVIMSSAATTTSSAVKCK